jgi:hypothetical protein
MEALVQCCSQPAAVLAASHSIVGSIGRSVPERSASSRYSRPSRGAAGLGPPEAADPALPAEERALPSRKAHPSSGRQLLDVEGLE